MDMSHAAVQIAALGSADKRVADRLADRLAGLGQALAQAGAVVLTGAGGGVGDAVARAAREAGALCLGVSPFASPAEHDRVLGPKPDCFAAMLYTGFGFKGRNVVLVRSADAVVSAHGESGTLNELTIAYDTRRPIGLFAGTGGITDRAADLFASFAKPGPPLAAHEDPDRLVAELVAAVRSRPGL